MGQMCVVTTRSLLCHAFAPPFVHSLQPNLHPTNTQHPTRQATFVRELSFRSRDASNLNATMRSIKELRKRSTARQKEAAEMEDLVVQPKLQVMRVRCVAVRGGVARGVIVCRVERRRGRARQGTRGAWPTICPATSHRRLGRRMINLL